MSTPAATLLKAAVRLRLSPLEGDSSDHVDLSKARGTNALARLGRRLRECVKNDDPRCHLAFIGHRGSGKSTELLRLEEQLSASFFPVHLYLDATLELDADYPEVILWMIEGIAGTLKREGIPFDKKHLLLVEKWFATVTKTDTSATSKEITLATEANAEAGFSFFGLGAKILGSLKSAIKGSRESREEIRQQVKKTGDELITIVNTYLAAAREALQAKHPGRRLLIVQDNLDRLPRDAALRIFQDGGEMIQRIEATCIWTPPVGSKLAPFNIGRLFEEYFMPMICVHHRDGKDNTTAIKELTSILAKRMDTKALFASPALVKQLVKLSGGSIRELLRLTERARLNASAEDRTRIAKEDVLACAKQAAISLQGNFIPNNVYFPILAQIALHKSFEKGLHSGFDRKQIEDRRSFFHELVAEEAVFCYNGESIWYDVHPAFHHLRDFLDTLAQVKAELARVPAAPVA